MNNIAISVIVTVYNAEKYLERCIDSLVFQTFEDVEIIMVDDCSTDSSCDIMEMWSLRFPEKIRLLKSEKKGIVHAKNTGIKAAMGRYITTVDSDAYIDYRMLNKMYTYAEDNHFPQVICSPVYEIIGKSKKKRGELSKPETIADFMKQDSYRLAGKLICKELFEEVGLLPILEIEEEAAWVFPAISKCKSIIYYPTANYYFEKCEDDINKNELGVAQKIIKASEIIISNCSKKYREQALILVNERILDYLNKNYLDRKILLDYIYENVEELKRIQDLEKKSSVLWGVINSHNKRNDSIPKKVYVNGFEQVFECELLKCENVFNKKNQVVIINESTCDLSTSPRIVQEAYEKDKMDFVGGYFAIKFCYEYGGVYIDAGIDVDAPFDTLVNDSAFFGYESDDTFTDKVFGCCAKNEVFKYILKTYEYPELYQNRYETLEKRIKTVLIGVGNVELMSQFVDKTQYGFCVYPMETFVQQLPYSKEMSLSHYKDGAGDGDSVTISKKRFKTLFGRVMRLNEANDNSLELEKALNWNRNQLKIIRNQLEWNREQRLAKEKENAILKAELSKYKKSLLFRIVWEIHMIPNRIRSLFDK